MKRWITSLAIAVALGGAPLAAQAARGEEAAYRKVEAQLATTTIANFSYEDADLAEVIKDIAKLARITIIVDKKALEALSEADRKVSMELVDIKAGNALNLVIDQAKLKKSFKNGLLHITTPERADEATVSRTYDVRDITFKIRDFPAPRIRLKAEDDNTAGPTAEFPDDDEHVETEDVVAIIEEQVTADWGGKASITMVKGTLIVRAPRNVQREVASLLRQLRAAK